MKKGLVVFQSKYGATEKYARWLAETMDYDCLPRADARADLCAPYEILVYGGGIYASGIAGFSFIRHHAAHWKNKKMRFSASEHLRMMKKRLPSFARVISKGSLQTFLVFTAAAHGRKALCVLQIERFAKC